MNKTAEKTPAPPHDLILEGRSKLTVTGVKRVLRCDADSAAMETGKGVLHLTGAELNVTSLDLESGEVRLTGRIDALEYTAERTPGGLLRRMRGRSAYRSCCSSVTAWAWSFASRPSNKASSSSLRMDTISAWILTISGSIRPYMRRPSSVRYMATRRRSPSRGLRSTQPLSSRPPSAREVRALSSCTFCASSEDSRPSSVASVDITPHSRRVRPKRASHMRMAMPPATPKKRLMRNSSIC